MSAKDEYNKLLARWNKAAEIESTLTDAALPELLKISIRLGGLLDEIGFYVIEDALKGFKILNLEVNNK